MRTIQLLGSKDQFHTAIRFILPLVALVLLQGTAAVADILFDDPTVQVRLDPFDSGGTINLSTILNQWGTPTGPSTFIIPGSGIKDFQNLNLLNDLGLNITTLTVSAYGTLKTNTSGHPAFSFDCQSGTFLTTCSSLPAGPIAGDTYNILQTDPEVWTFSGGPNILAGNLFNLKATYSGNDQGSSLFWRINVETEAPPPPPPPQNPEVPEPSSLLLMGSGLLGLARMWIKKQI